MTRKRILLMSLGAPPTSLERSTCTLAPGTGPPSAGAGAELSASQVREALLFGRRGWMGSGSVMVAIITRRPNSVGLRM